MAREREGIGQEELELGVRKVESAFRTFARSVDPVSRRTLRRFRAIIESPTKQLPLEPQALAPEIAHAVGVSYGQILDFWVGDFVNENGKSGRAGQPEKEVDLEFIAMMLKAGSLAFQDRKAVENFLKMVGDRHLDDRNTPIKTVGQMQHELLLDRINIAFTKYVDQIWFPAYFAKHPGRKPTRKIAFSSSPQLL